LTIVVINGWNRIAAREPEAFLRRTVTRLCLDQLKSSRRQRETYIGPRLPDPLVEEEEEDVTLPLMLALERFRRHASKLVRAGFVNGLPGFIAPGADGQLSTTALEIEDGKVAAIHVVRNPDKLRHLH